MKVRYLSVACLICLLAGLTLRFTVSHTVLQGKVVSVSSESGIGHRQWIKLSTGETGQLLTICVVDLPEPDQYLGHEVRLTSDHRGPFCGPATVEVLR